MFSVRMRSSRAGDHISGAERIVKEELVEQVAGQLAARALRHPLGRPDEIRISIDAVDDVVRLPALPVVEHSPEDADEFIGQLLRGVPAAGQAVRLLRSVRGLPGAALIDATTGARLDGGRGVRVSHIDVDVTQDGTKQAHWEALALATKVQHPAVCVAELCISDDPNYTTGYVSYRGTYHRIHHMKQAGSREGTRVFVVDGDGPALEAAVDFWRNTPVLVQP